MSGHSRWSQIKHQKGAADAKKGQLFSKMGKLIAIAAKKGADPDSNPTLAGMIERARAVNMPKDNIERAIQRGQDVTATELRSVVYQALGPEGVALVIEAITDNNNRTFNEVRMILAKHRAKLAVEGSLNWLFDRLAVVAANGAPLNDDQQLFLIEVGAIDITVEPEGITVTGAPESLHALQGALRTYGFTLASAAVEYIARKYLSVNPVACVAITKLRTDLEDHADIEAVFTNMASPK